MTRRATATTTRAAAPLTTSPATATGPAWLSPERIESEVGTRPAARSSSGRVIIGPPATAIPTAGDMPTDSVTGSTTWSISSRIMSSPADGPPAASASASSRSLPAGRE